MVKEYSREGNSLIITEKMVVFKSSISDLRKQKEEFEKRIVEIDKDISEAIKLGCTE